MRKITEKGHFHLPPLLVWTIVWALFFATLLLGWERLPNGDFAGQFHSFGLFQMRQFALGKLPLWSPGSFAGFPFAADTQSATFYPLRWLTLLLSLPGGFTYQMLTLEGLFHIWLAGIFTYALAFDMTRQRTAALIAATAFGLGGYLTSYPLLQLAILETMTWLPLVLLLLRRGMLNGKRPLPKLAAAAIVLGMAALVGHPQTFLHISYMAAAYYLFLSSRARWTWRWRLGLGSAIVLIAIGTTLIAAYPAWQYFRLTTRSDVGYEFVSHGFPLLNYLHLLLPRTLSLWTPEYVGLLPLALALLALWGRRYSKQSAEILFWGVVTAVAAWASLGDKGIIFQAIYRIVPGFSLFRQQERLVNLVSLSLALLAAQGFALFCQLSLPERRKLLQKVTPVIVGGLLLGGFSLAMAHPIVNDDWLFTWGRQLLLAVVILSLLWFSGKRRTTYLFVGLLALDLFVPIRAAMSLQTGSPDLFWPQPAWLTTLKADNPGRIDSRQLFHANVGEIYDLADVRGISPLQPQLVNRFESLPRPLRWQLLHVTHVVATTPIEPSLTAVAPIEQNIMPGEALAATLFRFEEALPHAWLSSQPIIVPDAEAAFQALQDPDFDATQQVILTEPLPLDLADVSVPETMPQVETVRTAANQLSLVVETAVPTVLVISEWALPGWQAVIDGKDISLLTVNYGLLGLPLAAGSHQIELSYTPPGLLLGTVATAVTLLLSIMLAWRWQPIISRQSTSQPKPIPLPAFPWNWQTLTDRVAKSVRQHWQPFMFATIFLGFGLRLFSLGQQELPGDEAFSYLFARMPLAEIIPTLLAEGDSHSPLHYLLLHGWMKLVGDSELALRFLSLLPGVLLLPLLAQLGRRIGGRPFALLLTLLLAISQSHVWISQDVRNQYTLGLLLIVSATLLLTKLVDEEWGGGINGRFSNTFSRWGWLLYALLSTLAVYSHYYTAFALLGHGIYILAQPPKRKQFWRWAGAGLLASLLFLPWVAVMLPGLLAAGQLSDPATPELANYLATVGTEAMAGSALSGSWLRWLFLGSLALSIVGARQLWRRHAGWAGLLLIWLGATTLFIYLIQFSRATFNPFYITIAAPAWWLLIVAGVQFLWRRRRVTAVFSIAALIIISSISLHNYYSEPEYSRSLGYRQMAEHITKQVQPDDLFLAHFPDPSLVYYLRNVALDYTMQPARYRPPVAETEQALAELAADYGRIWFVPAPGSAWDVGNIVPNWLASHTLREQETTYNRLTLSAHRSAEAAISVAYPIARQLGDAIQLDSVFVTVDGIPVDLERPFATAPESQLIVTILWHTSTQINEHYTVFVQLLDENGMLVAQDDNIPTKGLRPTTTWQSQEIIIDSHTLTLPVDRIILQGSLIVGMYQTETVERLLFDDGTDAAHIATIKNER